MNDFRRSTATAVAINACAASVIPEPGSTIFTLVVGFVLGGWAMMELVEMRRRQGREGSVPTANAVLPGDRFDSEEDGR